MYSIFQIGAQTTSDPFSIILNLLFFLLIFVSMFYGQKIQSWKAAKEIEAGLEKLKKWNDDCKKIILEKFKVYGDKKESEKDLAIKIEDFMGFIAIGPVTIDPYGVIPKLDFLMDLRDDRFTKEVMALAPNADEITRQCLENLMEAGMAVDFVYRLVKHFLILGKKSKSMIILLQIAMQMSIIMAMAKSYYFATKAFAEGSPIGDALGPMVAGRFVRDVSKDKDVEAKQIERDTIYQEVNFEDRLVYVVRAKGPGGTVGKPGTAIKELVEKLGDSLKLIIMVDAGLKLAGEKTGSVLMGVGAAIGGVGTEKFYIEESSTKKSIPIDAIICRQSLENAITTMARPITQSVPIIVEKIKMDIRKRTEKGSKVILAGIGNTIGIGI